MKSFFEWIGAVAGIGVIGIGIWVGTVNATSATNTKAIETLQAEVKATPTDVAVLQTQVNGLQTSVGEIKTEQSKQDDKLDKILEEIRRR